MKILEMDGPRGDVDRGVINEHLFAYIDHEGKIFMQADFYSPLRASQWNSEEWEARSCYLTGRANRANWQTLYSIGRALARHGVATINPPGQKPFTVFCDGCCQVTVDN